MASPPDDKNLVSLVAQEHIGPDSSGDNIGAKRVANYRWNGSAWERDTGSSAASSPSTSAVTSVNDTASSTTLIAADSSRLELIIQNDSSSTLYVKFGTTASSTDYTAKLYQDDILRTTYTGRVDGIWSSDSTGAAKITALSA